MPFENPPLSLLYCKFCFWMGLDIKPYICIKPELACFLKLSSKLLLAMLQNELRYSFNEFSDENNRSTAMQYV